MSFCQCCKRADYTIPEGDQDYQARSGNGLDRTIVADQLSVIGVDVPVLDREHSLMVSTNGGWYRK